jgi:signal peptidase I
MIDYSPQRVAPLITRQRFMVGSVQYTVWLPGDRFFHHANAAEGQTFRKGEAIIKMKVTSGDHLFVNRLTYNFRRPQRGEIVIFETKGIEGIYQQDTYYIKRLVALGNETVRIGNDQHLIINGQPLTAATPHFECVYDFGPAYREDSYFGHVNELVMKRIAPLAQAPLFADETKELTVKPKHYLVLGDNTMNSLDSRYWGDFPQEKVIGKSGFVYWPISRRFGLGYR